MGVNDRAYDKIAATWYAWGRQDAGDGRGVDVMAFGDHYAALAAAGGSRPSIQDAWAAFAATADEVAADIVIANPAMLVDALAETDALNGGSVLS